MRDKESLKREKERKRNKMEKKERKSQLLSICVQFAKRKTKYIGRNAGNFKKWTADL